MAYIGITKGYGTLTKATLIISIRGRKFFSCVVISQAMMTRAFFDNEFSRFMVTSIACNNLNISDLLKLFQMFVNLICKLISYNCRQ